RTTFSPPDKYIIPIRESIKDGTIPMSVIDARVRDVLRVKYQLGLFDRPYVDPAAADAKLMTPASMAVALQASRECIVLLKSDKPSTRPSTRPTPTTRAGPGEAILPLKKAGLKKVLVCGPNADE